MATLFSSSALLSAEPGCRASITDANRTLEVDGVGCLQLQTAQPIADRSGHLNGAATRARNGSAVCPWRAVIGDSSADGKWPVTAVDWPRRWAVSTPHKRRPARLDASKEGLDRDRPAPLDRIATRA